MPSAQTTSTAPPLTPATRNRRSARRLAAAVFAGDPRVWRWAAIAGLPLVVVIAVWCLVPRPYYTGTDSVNAIATNPLVGPGTPVCVGGLNIPAGTARVELGIGSLQAAAPRFRLTVSARGQTVTSFASGTPADGGAVRRVDFPLHGFHVTGQSVPASLCLRSLSGSYAVAGTPALQAVQAPVTQGGKPTLLRLAVWYRPPAGARRSYVGELGTMFSRGALLAAGFVRPWLFAVVFFVLLPLLAVLAVRCLALAAGGRARRLGLWVFVIAALNAAAWSVITPPFQGPDEVDHFGYVQSLVERGQKPTLYPTSPLARWSSAENDALLGDDMLTDHTAGDSRAPELHADVAAYDRLLAATPPRAGNGGGFDTASSYGPLYYYAVAPGYLIASSGSVFSQLEGVRLLSALIGALTSLFAFLIVCEVAPRQRWAAVLAGLVVAFEPMYAFLSGALNNDVGVDAGDAAVAWLLIRLIRRGPSLVSMCVLGALLGVLPFVKATAYEIYPLAILGILGAAWRHRSALIRSARRTVLNVAGLVASFAVTYAAAQALTNGITPAPPSTGAASGAVASSAGAAGSTLSVLLHHTTSYLTYLWEIFLPRLPGMTPHFPNVGLPAETIFIRRGWAAFGWYDVLFPHWVYVIISAAMLAGLALGLVAIVRRRVELAPRWIEVALLVLFPIVVVAAFEAAFYTPGNRAVIAEMGRYVFPALAPLAVLAVGALYAFGRRWLLPAGVGLLAVLMAFCYASQVLTFTAFFS